MHVGVISFPGSGGDQDALDSLEGDLGVSVRRVDYRETTLAGLDAVVLPGGFSYGDALRGGAIAKLAPVITSLKEAAALGLPILGIGNGFQILCESGMLPGNFLRNVSQRFHHGWVNLVFENVTTPWTNALDSGQVLRMPVAHGEGNYFIDAESLSQIEARGQVVARYADERGEVTKAFNGSVGSIASVCNETGNVVGIMAHPERATNDLIGGTDGLKMLGSLLAADPVATRE